ncbi:MAG TPA: type II secretion system F family protein [Opitutaceae bacterium]|nr:type II secretion system F family protein [Opitutaceae bacterium]
MARFSYTARDRAGKTLTADLDAPSRKDALRLLGARGLQIVAVTEHSAGTNRPKKSKKAQAAAEEPSLFGTTSATTPRRADCLPFLESLHDLISSGLSAGEAVRLLSVRIKEPRQRALSVALWEQLSEGAPLSRAMASFPQVFDPSITNLIQAGEATGSLTDTIARLIAHLTEQRELRKQLLTAMAYPVLMMCVAFVVVLFFIFVLLPKLQSLLSSLGSELPTSTKILIAVSNFAIHYGPFIIVAGVIGALAFWRWRATEAGRTKSDAWLLKLPMVGPFAISQTVLAFSQTLSVLLENGITAAEALRMTEKQINNRVHRAAFDTATARVLEGEALSVALGRTGCFPDLVLDRLAVGENTGNVVPSLKQIGKAYQKLISNQLNYFTKVLSSGVLITVFTFVGFIAFSIVSAVFKVSSSFKLGH